MERMLTKPEINIWEGMYHKEGGSEMWDSHSENGEMNHARLSYDPIHLCAHVCACTCI